MKKSLKYACCACGLVLTWAGYGLVRANRRPDLGGYRHLVPQGKAVLPGELTATFLGTTTLLLTDGQNALMIDGFFTRPGNRLQLLLGKVQTDRELVRRCLARLGVSRLDAVLVFHSHYDHVMDAPEVARQTRALLVGSESTANVGRGAGLPESQILVVQPGQAMEFGQFKVTFFLSRHIRLPWVAERTGLMGQIDKPLSQPASILAYREGGTFAISVEHPQGRSLLHSASFRPGELQGCETDTVFLCTPGLDKMEPGQRHQFFETVVGQTQARRIVPVHWDDFTLPLDQPLRPFGALATDLGAAMKLLEEEVRAKPGLNLEFLSAWQPISLRLGNSSIKQ